MKDLSHLPRMEPSSSTSPAGFHPVDEPRIVNQLIASWDTARIHDDNLPVAIPEAGPLRASWAGMCSRQIWYRLAGTEESNPNDMSSYWRMWLGTAIHDFIQAVTKESFPQALIEEPVNLNQLGMNGSSHVDMIQFDDDGVAEVIEIKSINGFGFKKAATRFSGPPEGPRTNAILQAALSAAALSTSREVSGCRLVYLSLEPVSPNLAYYTDNDLARFTAEWELDIETCIRIGELEAARMQQVLDAYNLDSDVPPVGYIVLDTLPELFSIAKIVNPSTGATVTADGVGGKTWQCAYCNFQDTCIASQASTVSITKADDQ